MPPRRQTTGEAIAERAFQMTRERGFASVTARALAASLHCSTQPIYQSFADMQALEREVARRGAAYMLESIKSRMESGLPRDLAFSLQYIRFALEEKHITLLIARNGMFRAMDDLADDSLPRIDPRMAVFVNGIVFLAVFQSLDSSWEQIKAITTDAYLAFRRASPEGSGENR